MKTIRGIVTVEYQFEFNTDLEDRREIQDKVEELWDEKVNLGLEDKHFHDTEIDFREV